MKLWLLCARKDLPSDDNPWSPWYDKAFGFVVRADTEDEARALATAESGDETHGGWRDGARIERPAWTDARYSTCVELAADGEAEVVLRDFSAA